MPVTVDPETFDIRVIENRDWQVKFIITDETGATVDITGATANFTVRKQPITASTIASYTVGDGITLSAPTVGELRVTGDPADTLGVGGPHVYELDITLGGVRDSVRIAKFTIDRKVT